MTPPLFFYIARKGGEFQFLKIQRGGALTTPRGRAGVCARGGERIFNKWNMGHKKFLWRV